MCYNTFVGDFMTIDDCIKNKSDDLIIGRGAYKNCYDFNNCVLLETCHLEENDLDNYIKNLDYLKNKLDNMFVNSFKIYDYKIFNNRVYILENKVKGDFLQEVSDDYLFLRKKEDINRTSNYIKKYINRLLLLNNKKILEKFVCDYFEILNNGLFVDASRPNNFLFDLEVGVSFLDISKLDNEYNKEFVFYYIFKNIIYFESNKCDFIEFDLLNDIVFSIIDIYFKLISVFKSLGFNKNMYINTPNGKMSDYLVNKIKVFIDKLYVCEFNKRI